MVENDQLIGDTARRPAMNRISSSLALLSLILTAGCVTTQNSSQLLREGYRDIRIDKPHLAEKRAKKILRARENDPAALVLLARARMARQDTPGALEALETLDHTNPADWACPDRVSLHEGYLLKSALSGNLRTLYRAQDVEASITGDLKSRHFLTLVDYYEKQGDPVRAASAFEQFENTQKQLVSDELMHGFILYYATLRMDDAKRLWGQLTPKQKTALHGRYKDIEL